LAHLVVEDKLVEAGISVNLDALEILKSIGRGCRAVRRGEHDIGISRRAGRRLQGDAFERERICGVEAERWLEGGEVFDFFDGCGCAADRDRWSVGVGAETVATDLYCVSASFVPSVGKSF
jgi:hypothetical protein